MMNSAAATTIAPWMNPQTMNVCWYPEALDHAGNRGHGYCRSDAVRAGDNTDTQASMVREPLEHVTDASAIHGARADAADGIPDDDAGNRTGVSGPDPARPDEDAADSNQHPRSKTVDQVSFKRYQPGFGENKGSKGHLHGGQCNFEVLY